MQHCASNIKITYRMTEWNGALNVEYQNGIAHAKMEFWRGYDAIVLWFLYLSGTGSRDWKLI